MREGGGEPDQHESTKCFKEKGINSHYAAELGKMGKERTVWVVGLSNMWVIDHNKSNFSGTVKTEAKFKYVEERMEVREGGCEDSGAIL